MPRINIAATIEQVTFPPEVWEWLDLFEETFATTQREAMLHDNFRADTPYKQLLVRTIHKDISSLTAIYLLLRCELIHQAAAHVRLFCESLITLQYISCDMTTRTPLFLDYAHVEVYKLATAALDRERKYARLEHVKQIEALVSQLVPEYNRVKSQYTFIDRRGRQRPFKNWCNIDIAEQARQCGEPMRRLYHLVYSQMSAYIHGSAWSLRRQLAYSQKHYQPTVVLNDIATVVRTALVVWEEWAKFCDQQAGWGLTTNVLAVAERLNELDARHFPVPG